MSSKNFMDYTNATAILTEYANKIKGNEEDIEKINNGEINLAVNPTQAEQAKMNIWIENN